MPFMSMATGTGMSGINANANSELKLDPQFEVAVELVTEAIAENPEDAALYLERSQVFQKAGDFDSALEDICTSRFLNPGNHELDFELANLHQQLGSADSAFQYVNRFIALEPDNAKGFFKRAEINMLLGKSVAATNDFLYALEMGKKPNATTYINVAKTVLKVNPEDFDRALGWLKHGKSTIGLSEEMGDYELELLVQKGDMHSAIHLTDDLLKKYSSSPRILYRKGQLLEQTAMPSSAKQCYNTALEAIRSKGNSRLDIDGLATIELALKERLREMDAEGY